MSKRAVIYTRISKDRAEQTSIATQEAEARELCERRGWTVVKVEIDQGRSAFKSGVKRPAFERAMKLIEAGAADVLVVWKLDRLHRGLVDFWNTYQRIERAGGQLVSVTDDLDTTRTAGKIMVSLIAGFAEMESEVKSDRALAWHAERRARALPPTGPTPFGYERRDGNLVVVEADAAEILTAAEAVLATGTVAPVLADWNRRSVGGGGWTHRGVRRVLTSPTTSGRRDVEGELVEGNWPKVLDVDTADRVREILLDPARRTSPTNERQWLLAGFATCACGGKLRSKFHPKGKRYACRECSKSIGAEVLDTHVERSLLAAVDRQAWEAMRRAGRAPMIDTEALGARLREIAADYAAGRVDREVYEAAKAEQARVIAEADAELVELPEVDDLHASWDDLTVDAKLLVVAAFIDDVTLRPGQLPVEQRATIQWRS